MIADPRPLSGLSTSNRFASPASADRANLTVKKIPKAVLTRCEWGKDDYSLRIENLPQAPPPEGQQELFDE